jgi:hypothetical protein
VTIMRPILIATVFALTACTPLSPEAQRLSFAEICANAPETRAMIRDWVISEPGMVDLACQVNATLP